MGGPGTGLPGYGVVTRVTDVSSDGQRVLCTGAEPYLLCVSGKWCLLKGEQGLLLPGKNMLLAVWVFIGSHEIGR